MAEDVFLVYDERLDIILSFGISTISLSRVIDKNAHVSAIYLLPSSLYNILAWAIVYYWVRAVESLTVVVFNSFTPLLYSTD